MGDYRQIVEVAVVEKRNTRWQKAMERGRKDKWACLPSPPDPRDFPLSRIAEPVAVPASVRLDHLVPFVLDQGSCGTCVGQAGAGVLNAYGKHRGNLPDGGLSALYLYSRCKQEDGIPEQEGTYCRTALKIMQKEGACPEGALPYSQLPQDACLRLPGITDAHRTAAAPYRVKAYAALNGLQEIKQALAAGKLVLAAGLVTSENWINDPKGGYITTPEGWIYGGHAFLLCGYDDNLTKHGLTGWLRGPNSWGEAWGDKGFFWLSYEFVNWVAKDLGYPALMEAWAVEIDGLPDPGPGPGDGDGKIVMWIDKPTALVNGVEVPIDPGNPKVAPRILEARTMVPARFVAEALGAQVDYHDADKRVEITRRGDK